MSGLRQMAGLYGIDISDAQEHVLDEYLRLVYETNQVMNLTRIAAEDAQVLHTLDSLLFACALPPHVKPRRMVDIGTGAGFPGVPLVEVLGCSALLIDSVAKKIDAVTSMVKRVGMDADIQTEAIRAEDLARREREAFDLVVARAVSDASVLMEYASPLLSEGGYLVLSKAPLSGEERGHAEKVAAYLKFVLVSRETVSLPEGKGERELLCYQKTAEAPVKLPRKTGLATKRPLYRTT